MGVANKNADDGQTTTSSTAAQNTRKNPDNQKPTDNQKIIDTLKNPATLKNKLLLQEEYIMERLMTNKARNYLILFLGLVVLVAVLATQRAYDPANPSTWSGNELKEWLAEHRIAYRGIPEKGELAELVRSNWVNLREDSKSTGDSVSDFVQQYTEIAKNRYAQAEDLSNEKLTEFTEEVANTIETLRQNTGLTEDQMASAFDQIKKQLASAKSKTTKNLADALDVVSGSYKGAQAKRDQIAKEAATRIRKDYKKTKGVSQDTVNWFKDQINQLSEAAGFAKTRTQTQTALILGSIEEILSSSKDASVEQIQSTTDSLNDSAKEYYKDIEGNLERLRNELSGRIGDSANYIVQELRDQVSTLDEYRLMTQEKVQGVIDRIGQKLYEGKTVTRDQFIEVARTIRRYMVYPVKSYYDSTTEQVKETSTQVRDASQESLNRLVETIRNAFTNARERPEDKMARVYENVEEQLKATQQLTGEQTAIFKQTVKEQLGNVKDVRDLTEDKVASFIEVLKQRWSQALDNAQQGYEATKDKAKQAYEDTKDKTNQGYEATKDKAKQAYDAIRDEF